MSIDWKQYSTTGLWDELVTPGGRARKGAGNLRRVLARLSDDELVARKTAAELAIRSMGITFTVYTGEGRGSIDREWPFDIVPRLLLKREWDQIAAGLKQRVVALNRFIDDVYHEQRAFKDDVLPREYVEQSREFRAECIG
ncbi:MAG: circularly permuted type 2 ATP-grasp protein, partial [Pseudomonadales bacterium]